MIRGEPKPLAISYVVRLEGVEPSWNPVPKTGALSIRPQAHILISNYYFPEIFFFGGSWHIECRISKFHWLIFQETLDIWQHLMQGFLIQLDKKLQ